MYSMEFEVLLADLLAQTGTVVWPDRTNHNSCSGYDSTYWLLKKGLELQLHAMMAEYHNTIIMTIIHR